MTDRDNYHTAWLITSGILQQENDTEKITFTKLDSAYLTDYNKRMTQRR